MKIRLTKRAFLGSTVALSIAAAGQTIAASKSEYGVEPSGNSGSETIAVTANKTQVLAGEGVWLHSVASGFGVADHETDVFFDACPVDGNGDFDTSFELLPDDPVYLNRSYDDHSQDQHFLTDRPVFNTVTPGTYTFRVRARTVGAEAATTIEVEFLDPDVVFAGPKTVLVTNQGTSDPLYQTGWLTAPTINGALAGMNEDRRIVLKRGEIYNEALDFDVDFQVYFQAMGTGARPQIFATTSSSDILVRAKNNNGGNGTLVFRGIELASGFNDATESGQSVTGFQDAKDNFNWTFYDSVIRDTNMGVWKLFDNFATYNWYNLYWGTHIRGWRNFGMLIRISDHLGYVGSTFQRNDDAKAGANGKGGTNDVGEDNSFNNWHGPSRNSRGTPGSPTVILKCDFFCNAGWPNHPDHSWSTAGNTGTHQPCLRYGSNAPNHDTVLRACQNVFEGGWDVLSLTNSSRTADSFSGRHNMIVDCNQIIGTANTKNLVSQDFSGITARNNLMFMASGRSEHRGQSRGRALIIGDEGITDPTHQAGRVHWFSNLYVTYASDGDQNGGELAETYATFPDTEIANNVIYAPNKSDTGNLGAHSTGPGSVPIYKGMNFGTFPLDPSFASPPSLTTKFFPTSAIAPEPGEKIADFDYFGNFYASGRTSQGPFEPGVTARL